MAKLGDFKTPTGVSGNIFSPMTIVQMILGTVVLFFTVAVGQNIASRVNGKAGGFIDTKVEQPWSSPATVAPTKQRQVY